MTTHGYSFRWPMPVAVNTIVLTTSSLYSTCLLGTRLTEKKKKERERERQGPFFTHLIMMEERYVQVCCDITHFFCIWYAQMLLWHNILLLLQTLMFSMVIQTTWSHTTPPPSPGAIVFQLININYAKHPSETSSLKNVGYKFPFKENSNIDKFWADFTTSSICL